MSEEVNPLAEFKGVARLFPLPNLVLFPHVTQPLHIFEARYRQLTAESLDGDRLIAPVLLRPGWEGGYEGNPLIHEVACLGHIIAEQRLDDGRYNLLLRGLSRVRLVEEIATCKLFRAAKVELLNDCGIPSGAEANELRHQLKQEVEIWFSGQPKVLQEVRKLIQSSLPLGILADIVAFALPIPVEVKQDLLEQLDVERRVGCLLKHMKKNVPSSTAEGKDRKFPPEFSTN